MAADGVSGSKNQPQFLDVGAPDLATDLNIVADYAAKVGNRRTGTTAERTGAAGKDVGEGLLWGDTTDGLEYRYAAGSWVRTGGKVGGTPYAMAAGAGSNATGAYTTVVFPAGRFTVVPWVTAMSNGAVPAMVHIGSISKDQMTIAGFSGSSAVQSNWYWQAVQMTPTSATG